MSRSRRYSPFNGWTTSQSEKQDKRKANRKLRRRTKACILANGDNKPLPVMREVSDPWCFAKDGKMLFNRTEYPKLMRK